MESPAYVIFSPLYRSIFEMYARWSRSANTDTNSWRSFSLRLCQCLPSARLAVSSKSKILSASFRTAVRRSCALASDFKAGSSTMRMTWSTDTFSWSVGTPAPAGDQGKSNAPKPRRTDTRATLPGEHVLSGLVVPCDRSLIPLSPPLRVHPSCLGHPSPPVPDASDVPVGASLRNEGRPGARGRGTSHRVRAG